MAAGLKSKCTIVPSPASFILTDQDLADLRILNPAYTICPVQPLPATHTTLSILACPSIDHA